jgi:hypothetical protein
MCQAANGSPSNVTVGSPTTSACQRSGGVTGQSGAHSKRKVANQMMRDRCRQGYPVCTGLSDAPADIRRSSVSKGRSNEPLSPWALKWPLGASTSTPSILKAHHNFETPRPHCSSVLERFKHVSELSLCLCVLPLSSLLVCVLLVWLCSCVRVLTLSPLL